MDNLNYKQMELVFLTEREMNNISGGGPLFESIAWIFGAIGGAYNRAEQVQNDFCGDGSFNARHGVCM